MLNGNQARTLTPCNDIEDKDNESNDASTSSSLPRFGALNGDWCSLDKKEHRQLEKGGKDVVEHFGGDLGLLMGYERSLASVLLL